MKFIHMDDWTEDELCQLNKKIFGVIDFSYGNDMTEQDFIARYNNPRALKDALKGLYRLNINEISKNTLMAL